MHILTSQINVAVRKRKTGGKILTAGELKLQGGVDSLIQFDNGYRILKQLRGSPPYWEAAQKDLMAMIRQLGPATLFMTLSAAETRWNHLLKLLSQVIDNKILTDSECQQLTWSEKCRLISSDPVTCSRHFHYSVQTFLSQFLNTDSSPFGRLVDWWLRIEFQHRGSPHVHMLLWIENAPRYGTNENSEVIQYIDKIISCRREVNSQEVNALTDLQLHRHTRTCRKQIRKSTVCRFGFPKYPLVKTEILQPLICEPAEKRQHTRNLNHIRALISQLKTTDEEMTMESFMQLVNMNYDDYISVIRSSLKTDTLFLQRSPSEIRVNNYNIECLKAWRANTDIQYVLDVFACASYITSYVAKSDRGMSELLHKACQEARHEQSNLKQQFRCIGNKFLNNVEITAQEAVYLLLQMPLRQSSRQTVFINTSLPEDRVYLLKNDLSHLSDDEQVSASNLISRYSKRSKKLETVTLADYAAWYDHTRVTASEQLINDDEQLSCDETDDMPGGANTARKRKHARIIRFVRFAKNEPEKYYREKLMLYTHWRNEVVDLLDGFATFEQRYNSIKSTLIDQLKTYEPFLDAVDNAELALAEESLDDQWDTIAPAAQQMQRQSENLGDIEAENYASIHPHAHGQAGLYDMALTLALSASALPNLWLQDMICPITNTTS
jgi:hypothetical protein